MRFALKSFLALALGGLIIAPWVWAQSFEVPALKAPVMDLAGIVNEGAEQSLNRALSELQRSAGTQVQVLTVPNLGGLPIEQASIEVVEKWQLGRGETDRGVLLLVSTEDRDVRIEVGYGLEGDLTDLESNQIIRNSILPLFKAGDMTAGILTGVFQIVSTTDPEFSLQNYFEGEPLRRKQESPLGGGFTFLVYVILFILMLIISRGNPLFLLLLLSGGRGGGFGGGGGGFGGGGGGWSGGGGGFGGGGASGSW